MKISVLLATNRLNGKCFKYMKNTIDNLNRLPQNTFTQEFRDLAYKRLAGAEHFLEPTLKSLDNQTFGDFELILSHRYKNDALDIINNHDWDFPIKLVDEKPSIWHDLGEQYHTVANNKNTAFINSKGDLIYHIDDLTFFNEHLLQEVWDLWNEGKYMTGRTVRCITYNKKKRDEVTRLGPGKIRIQKNGWIGQVKNLIPAVDHPQIPMSMFWTCSASVSAAELLEINGYDELYDGSLSGIDMDAGTRHEKISKYDRVASDNYLYEIDDPTPKNMVRDDVMMRQIMRVRHVRANSWKATSIQIRRFRMWMKHNEKLVDPNWDKLTKVPLYDIKRIK